MTGMDFLERVFSKAHRRLAKRHGVTVLDGLTWGSVNKVDVRHPLTEGVPHAPFFSRHASRGDPRLRSLRAICRWKIWCQRTHDRFSWTGRAQAYFTCREDNLVSQARVTILTSRRAGLMVCQQDFQTMRSRTV